GACRCGCSMSAMPRWRPNSVSQRSGATCHAPFIVQVLIRAFSVPIESERRLYFFVLTRFLDANRYPPTDQVRGHASLENALVVGPRTASLAAPKYRKSRLR